jgi:hypothetical protein
MALIRKNRALQYPLMAEFTFNMVDTMLATDGVVRTIGGTGATVFDVSNLPPGAVVVGGEVIVEVAANDTGATATIKVGDSGSATRYLGTTTVKTAGRSALVPTGYRSAGEDIRITMANANGDSTAGTVTVRVLYTITGRTNEVQTH